MATRRRRKAARDVAPPVLEGKHAALIEQGRKSLMEAIPEFSTAIADSARKGSVPHGKLLLQMIGMEDGGFAPVVVRQKERTLRETVMEAWEREP